MIGQIRWLKDRVCYAPHHKNTRISKSATSASWRRPLRNINLHIYAFRVRNPLGLSAPSCSVICKPRGKGYIERAIVEELEISCSLRPHWIPLYVAQILLRFSAKGIAVSVFHAVTCKLYSVQGLMSCYEPCQERKAGRMGQNVLNSQ